MNIEEMISKLADNYKKDIGTNNYKLFQLINNRYTELENTRKKIQDFRVIDKAVGVGLDFIGEDVGQPRNGMNDSQYRKMIKVRIRANLSNGENPLMNDVLTVLLGDRFNGMDETWSLPAENPLSGKNAALLISLSGSSTNKYIPFDEIEKIKAGGVGVYWQINNDSELNLQSEFNTYEGEFIYCGTFNSGGGVL